MAYLEDAEGVGLVGLHQLDAVQPRVLARQVRVLAVPEAQENIDCS